jgi:hypothetical protein
MKSEVQIIWLADEGIYKLDTRHLKTPENYSLQLNEMHCGQENGTGIK